MQNTVKAFLRRGQVGLCYPAGVAVEGVFMLFIVCRLCCLLEGFDFNCSSLVQKTELAMKYSTLPMRVETASSVSTASRFSLDLNKFRGIFHYLLWRNSKSACCFVLGNLINRAALCGCESAKVNAIYNGVDRTGKPRSQSALL